MIIALDAVDILTALGAEHVHTANSVVDALRILDAQPIDFGLLDVNLGVETSVKVAQALHKAGVPFVLATGYGTFDDITDAYPRAPIVKKPYTVETVRRALAMCR